jgi:hypothetical protein
MKIFFNLFFINQKATFRIYLRDPYLRGITSEPALILSKTIMTPMIGQPKLANYINIKNIYKKKNLLTLKLLEGGRRNRISFGCEKKIS